MKATPDIRTIILKNYHVVESWYVDRMMRLLTQPQADIYQLLLTAHHFGITTYSVKRSLLKISADIDPPEAQRPHIVTSCLRQIVLMQYDLAMDERQRWFSYWFDKRNISGESIVTIAYIVNLAAESQNLLSETSMDYIAEWHVRHDDLRAPKSRAWAPRALALCGHKELARVRAEQLISEREKNGSWQGGYDNTAAMAYALLRSNVVAVKELENTVYYLVQRLERGVTANVALESTTLKILKIAGLLSLEQEQRLIHSVNKDRSVFLSHSSCDHPFVLRLCKRLTDYGVKVWIDEVEISGGDSLTDKIVEGLADMQHFVVVLSTESVNASWVKREVNYALVDKLEARHGKIIPVLKETCEIPGLLRELHHVDFRDDFDKGFQRLLKAIDVETTLTVQD